MQQSVTGPHLLTVKQVAESLGISPRQVWKLNSSARLPAPVRIGGSRSVRWRALDIARFVEMGCPARDQFELLSREGTSR